MLPSVDPLSTTVTAAPSTSPSCAEIVSMQARVWPRLFQLTTMMSVVVRTRLQCGVLIAREWRPAAPAHASKRRTFLCLRLYAAAGRNRAGDARHRTTDARERRSQ